MYIKEPEYNKEFNEFEEVLNLSAGRWIKFNGKLYKKLLREGYKYTKDLSQYLEEVLLIDIGEYEKGIKHEGIFGKDSNLAMSSYQVPDGCQIPDPTLQKSEETIGNMAQRILQDKLGIRDIRAEAYALALSAKNANAGSSRLSHLRRELKSLAATLEIIEATKFSNITKKANEIQQNQPLADVIIMLCIRPTELTSLHITDAGVTGKPGCKWFNRFLKDYDLISRHLRKLGAVYGAIVHEAQNLAH
ncbi:18750_t:CDS:2, partial [Gigaspora margarita]